MGSCSRVAWVSAAHMSTKLTCGAAGQKELTSVGVLIRTRLPRAGGCIQRPGIRGIWECQQCIVVWFAGRLASGHAFEFRELMWTPSPHSRASMSHQSKASAPPQPPHHYPPTSRHPIATDKHPHKPIRHGPPHPPHSPPMGI